MIISTNFLLDINSIIADALNPIGVISLIISSITWAVGSLYSSKIQLPVSIFASSGMIMLSGGLMLLIVSIALGEYHNLDLLQISNLSLIAQIYLIGIITVVGFTDFYGYLELLLLL